MASSNPLDYKIQLLPTQSTTHLQNARGGRHAICSAAISRGALVLMLGFLLGCFVFWQGGYGSLQRRREQSHYLKTSRQRHGLETSHVLNFLVVGDWGRQGLYNQSAVAIQMGRIGTQADIEFVISTGDNFYETGLRGANDSLFAESFTNIYTAPSLQTTWYSVLGNHDYLGDTMAELSHEIVKRDPRWFCRREFQLHRLLCKQSDAEDCDMAVDFFFIDTTPLIDEYWLPGEKRKFNWTGLAPRKEQLQLQLQNLTHSLNESTALWKIVVGHHTMRSIGHHGDYKELLTQVLPILEENGVDVYINGHDHNLQHIKRADSPVHFITSGGGSKAWNGLRPALEEDGVQFAYDGQGFVAVSVDPKSLTFSFHDVFGRLLASTTLRGEGKKE